MLQAKNLLLNVDGDWFKESQELVQFSHFELCNRVCMVCLHLRLSNEKNCGETIVKIKM